MKEYIDKVLYEASGLTIGFNEPRTCLIFGQNSEWVVLDNNDIKKLQDSMKKDLMEAKFDGFNYSIRHKGVFLRQCDNSVFVPREIFGKWAKC